MNKWQQFKHAVKNPPPDRLAKIEYQSHFLHMIGITVVSIVLIYRGLWYIVFAFIFMLGVSYSQGMSAYKKYKNISALMPKEKPEDFTKDISFTRRRGKIIHHVFGYSSKWMAASLSVFSIVMIIGADHSRLFLSISYPLLMLVLYYLFYFEFLYRIANYQYKREIEI